MTDDASHQLTARLAPKVNSVAQEEKPGLHRPFREAARPVRAGVLSVRAEKQMRAWRAELMSRWSVALSSLGSWMRLETTKKLRQGSRPEPVQLLLHGGAGYLSSVASAVLGSAILGARIWNTWR